MTTPPYSFIIFVTLYFVFFILRNFFYLRLWKYKSEIINYGVYPIIFPKGINKMINTIKLEKEINNIEIMYLIQKVNIFSKLLSVSILLVVFMSIIEILFLRESL